MSSEAVLMPREVIRQGAARLTAAGMPQARQEAEWLLGVLIGRPPLEVYLQDWPLSLETVREFFSQVEARAQGIPLQYVLGEAEFFGRRFAVSPGVFIPRPETEAIVAHALGVLQPMAAGRQRPLRLLDLGTGSGCIAVTLAAELPTCLVVGVEVSWNALRIARQNVRRYELDARVALVQGSWAEAIRGRFDAIVSNPPYIPSAQVDHLPLDVRQEPRLSLDGGTDGLRDLSLLVSQAPRLLRDGGVLIVECAEAQVDPLQDDGTRAPWVERAVPLHDLANRPRGVALFRR